MAYCNNCGAYIPDGQSKCLACGFDESEQEAKTAAAAAAQSAPNTSGRFDSELLRRQLEEQRQRQRENSKKWAEAEFARRQRQQEQRERSAADYVNREQKKTNAAVPDYAAGLGSVIANSKVLAALSYLGPLCILPFLLGKNDEFAQFHGRQGLGLFLTGIGANLVSTILGLNWLVTLMWIFMIFKGMSAANAGKREALPYIGGLFLKK